MTNLVLLGKSEPFNLVRFKGVSCYVCVSHHPVPITKLFQTPALIIMSIAATRMHRSLTDFTCSGYHASHLLCSVLILTAADAVVLRPWMPTRLGRGARGKEIPNGSSHRQIR